MENVNENQLGDVGRLRSGKAIQGRPASKRTALGTITHSINQRKDQESFEAPLKGNRIALAPIGTRAATHSDPTATDLLGAATSTAQFQIYCEDENQQKQTDAGQKSSNEVKENALEKRDLGNRVPDIHGEVEPMQFSEQKDPAAFKEYAVQQAPEPTKAKDDVFNFTAYDKKIFAYIREQEVRNRARPGYMRKQPDVSASMRAILVDWLVEVTEEYRLEHETLFLAVSYIDRFLSQMSVLRGKLQLVGTASMFLASKFEEIYPPELSEFVYITDDTYTKQQILRMEMLILKVLRFDVATPTSLYFLGKYLTHGTFTNEVKFLAQYLLELALLQADPFLYFLPSVQAGAALALACSATGSTMWSDELEEFTGYKLTSDLSECVEAMYQSWVQAPSFQQQAVPEKFRSRKYCEVSTLPIPEGVILDANRQASG